MDLDTMSWVIGVGNPLSASLTGPLFLVLLGQSRATPFWVAGWVVLLIAQITFLAFGFTAGYPGFKYAQPAMLMVAAMNLALGVWIQRPAGRAWLASRLEKSS